jgi:hypothetical protein
VSAIILARHLPPSRKSGGDGGDPDTDEVSLVVICSKGYICRGHNASRSNLYDLTYKSRRIPWSLARGKSALSQISFLTRSS